MKRTEPLGDNIKIFVSDNHHFTTDTILLANFANAKKKDLCADLGTGCGTIPLLFCRQNAPFHIDAVDIQQEAIELLKDSIDMNSKNGIESVKNISPLLADIKDLDNILEKGKYTLITCNPPYTSDGAGIKPPKESKSTAHFETECTIDDICRISSKLLQFSGRLCLCQRPQRLSDIIMSLKKYNLEPKRLRLVQGRAQKPPKLFLLEARLGANPGFLTVDPTLIIEKDDGSFTDEMLKIYGKYKEGYKDE